MKETNWVAIAVTAIITFTGGVVVADRDHDHAEYREWKKTRREKMHDLLNAAVAATQHCTDAEALAEYNRVNYVTQPFQGEEVADLANDLQLIISRLIGSQVKAGSPAPQDVRNALAALRKAITRQNNKD